jgi:hypothetical protein
MIGGLGEWFIAVRTSSKIKTLSGINIEGSAPNIP